jgi:anti-sigma factor RsiW
MKVLNRACRKCREAIRLHLCDGLLAEQQAAMEQHLTECIDCRNYARELRETTEGLQRLSCRSVEPNPNFHARWTMAIQTSDQPAPLARVVAEWIAWSRGMVLQNRRILAALAPVWLLIFMFKVTAPEVSSVPLVTMARSPVEIFRALTSEENGMIALDRRHLMWSPAKTPSNSPRSGRATLQPVAFLRELEINTQPLCLS